MRSTIICLAEDPIGTPTSFRIKSARRNGEPLEKQKKTTLLPPDRYELEMDGSGYCAYFSKHFATFIKDVKIDGATISFELTGVLYYSLE